MESLVLKGGNAIEMGYSETIGKVSRTSFDLDFSIIDNDFKESIELIEKRIEQTLTQTFLENGYVILDFKFEIKPRSPHEETMDFWGGYKVTFKLIEQEKFLIFDKNVEKAIREALPIHKNRSPNFELEFSKYEYVDGKTSIKLDGYTINIYTPQMIVFEKIRALCQQLPEYKGIVPSFTPRARARDFYDIWMLMDCFNINPALEENLFLIKNIFLSKKVPLEFINKLRNNKVLHSENWIDVQATLSASEEEMGFDFYFDFVLSKFENLKFP